MRTSRSLRLNSTRPFDELSPSELIGTHQRLERNVTWAACYRLAPSTPYPINIFIAPTLGFAVVSTCAPVDTTDRAHVKIRGYIITLAVISEHEPPADAYATTTTRGGSKLIITTSCAIPMRRKSFRCVQDCIHIGSNLIADFAFQRPACAPYRLLHFIDVVDN
jgi:hypothetical protein